VGDIVIDSIGAKRSQHEIQLLGEPAGWAMLDRAAFEQALGHLIQNAIEASPSDRPVTVRVDRDAEEVSVAIRDKGPGMNSDFVRNRLFKPFSSTKPSGFGIGAFEAHSLVTAMGGRIGVDSRPGEGSTFTIYLRAAEPQQQRKKVA
jgi:signal transduction histidine kinase